MVWHFEPAYIAGGVIYKLGSFLLPFHRWMDFLVAERIFGKGEAECGLDCPIEDTGMLCALTQDGLNEGTWLG